MVLAYPLSQADFMSILPIQSMEMDIPEQVEISQTGKGEVIAVDIGERLWQGTITLGTITNFEAGRPQVLIDVLRGGGKTFLAYDARRPTPLMDPGGYILSDAAPVIGSLPADARTISLSALPPAYVLASGDYLGFTFSSNPTRYALHRVVDEWVYADGAGATPVFEVMPPLDPGAAVGAAVTLINAPCKAMIVPGSMQRGSGRKTIYSGQSFQFIQTMG